MRYAIITLSVIRIVLALIGLSALTSKLIFALLFSQPIGIPADARNAGRLNSLVSGKYTFETSAY